MTAYDPHKLSSTEAQGEDELDRLLPCDCGFLKGFAFKKGDPCEGCWAVNLKKAIRPLITKAKEQAREELLDELEKELPLSERLAWSDEDGSYMDVRVFNNNINIWIQAHRQSKRTPTEKEKP